MQKSSYMLAAKRDSRLRAPIAVFDSGVGGLTVAHHIRTALPHENLLYFADCGWAPYGPRPPAQITTRVLEIADWLVGQQAKALVVACNTATTVAIGALRERFPQLPIIGVEPGVQPALRASRSRVIGILATQATLDSPWFDALLARQAGGATFIRQPGHGLVELIERGQADSPEMDALLRRFLIPLCEAGADTLVLGSTHFPLLAPAIARCVGERLRLIDTGPAVASRVMAVVGAGRPDGRAAPGLCRIYSSAHSDVLAALASQMLGVLDVAGLVMTGSSSEQSTPL